MNVLKAMVILLTVIVVIEFIGQIIGEVITREVLEYARAANLRSLIFLICTIAKLTVLMGYLIYIRDKY